MKIFATSEKQSAPGMRKVRSYVHHPLDVQQHAQRAEIGRILRSTGAQAKLSTGQPNDKPEQEADRVADQVMASPESRLQRQPESMPEQPAENQTRHGTACVDSEEIPKNHTGVQARQGIVHDYFKMEADWNDTGPVCRCTCGEYRQYVKGHVIVNNRRVRKRLYNNAFLEEDNYHEDADHEGPNDAGRPYGHRTGYQNTNNDKFIDAEGGSDRETACRYRAFDTPGIPAVSGSMVDMHLKFKGQTYDRCQNRFGPIHEWESIWNGRVP